MDIRNQPTYADETRTGEVSEAFRGLGRATVAARVEDPNGFEWLLSLKRDHFPKQGEIKSSLVLAIITANKAARDSVYSNIARATIFITDLGEHYRDLLSGIFRKVGKEPPTRSEAIAFLTELPHDLSEKLLTNARESAPFQTTIPRIEALLREVVNHSGLPQGGDSSIVDHNILRELNQQTFQEFVTRFAVAFADVLAPSRQVASIVEAAESVRFLTPGHIAFMTLGDAITMDRFFDFGNEKAFSELEKAHERILQVLEDARENFFWKHLRGGTLKQEDSAQLLGIQAADVAARLASKEYERFPDDRLAGARTVKQLFDRVLLNNQWI